MPLALQARRRGADGSGGTGAGVGDCQLQEGEAGGARGYSLRPSVSLPCQSLHSSLPRCPRVLLTRHDKGQRSVLSAETSGACRAHTRSALEEREGASARAAALRLSTASF